MKKTNKMLAGLVIGTMAFAGLAAMPVENANLSAGIQNVAYASVNKKNVKLAKGSYDANRNVYTFELTGLNSKDLGPVDEFFVASNFDGDLYTGVIDPGNYSIEDKNGKMVISFPGQNLANFSIAFRNAYLGMSIKPNQGEKVVLDSLEALDLKSYKQVSKDMLHERINKDLITKQELENINKIIDRGNSVFAVVTDCRALLNMFDEVGGELSGMVASGKYSKDQIDAKTRELLGKRLEEIMPSLKQAPKQESKKETPKKENKKEKNLSQVDRLKASIEDNKITTKAAQLLLDTVPDLNKEVTTKLQDLIKKSDALIVKAEKALEKLEKAGK